MIYTKEQINMYLTKIGYNKKIELNGKTLQELQISHLKNIPYENLTILNHIPLSLDAEALFEKMIMNYRGGFCFELNGLYSNLLKSLGFDVINLAGRFILDETSYQMRRHRILKVITNDGIYICDVGVRSESPRMALKLIHGLVQNDCVSEYKFLPDDVNSKKISIFTDTANITLVGNTLKFYENGKTIKEVELENMEEVDNALETYFKIKI